MDVWWPEVVREHTMFFENRTLVENIQLRLKLKSEEKSRTNISIAKLNTLLRFYPQPINVVVYHGSSGRSHLGRGLALRCFQRLSFPNIAAQRCF